MTRGCGELIPLEDSDLCGSSWEQYTFTVDALGFDRAYDSRVEFAVVPLRNQGIRYVFRAGRRRHVAWRHYVRVVI